MKCVDIGGREEGMCDDTVGTEVTDITRVRDRGYVFNADRNKEFEPGTDTQDPGLGVVNVTGSIVHDIMWMREDICGRCE